MKGRVAVALRWIVGLAIVAFVATRFDVQAVGARLANANLLLALPAIAGLVAVHNLGALAWRRLLQRFAGVRTDWGSAVRMYYAAQAVGSITPGNLGADAYRIAAVDGASTRRAAAVAILLQRVTSTFALAILAGAGMVALGSRDLANAAPWILGGVALVLLAVAAAVIRRDALRAAWPRARAAAGSLLVDGVGLGLAFHLASIGLSWVLIAAIDPGTAGHTVEVLAILAVARLSVVLPISPAGLGVQEAAVSVLFVGAGLDPRVALAGILLNRVALAVVVLIGAVALLRGRPAGTTTSADRELNSTWGFRAASKR